MKDKCYHKYGKQNHPSWGYRILCRTCSSPSTLEAQLHLFWVRVLCAATIYGSLGPFYLTLPVKGRVLMIIVFYIIDYAFNLQLLSLSVQMYDHTLLICMHSFYDMHKVDLYRREHVYTHFTSKLLTKFGG